VVYLVCLPSLFSYRDYQRKDAELRRRCAGRTPASDTPLSPDSPAPTAMAMATVRAV